MALDPVTAILNVGNSLIDRLLPNKEENDKAKAALLQMQIQGDLNAILGQIEVDKTEAASQSLFVAGWRPAVGWCCAAALTYQFLVSPLGTWVAALSGHPVAAPSLDLGSLMTLLLGMLGMGALRSYDKTQGTGNGH